MQPLANDEVSLVGVPWDEASSYLRGPALAPARIREVLYDGAGNEWTELGHNPFKHEGFRDRGDLIFGDYEGIGEAAAEWLATGTRLLALGGDHSITFPLVRALAELRGRDFDILHFDAHADLYDEFEGDRYSHACPFARIMEAGLCRRLVQVGIRTLTPHQRRQAERFGVEIIEMRAFEAGVRPQLDRPVYISIDLDGFDPAYAPGVSHHEPGGLRPREVLRILHGLDVPIVGADIVELNPHRDPTRITAALAAKLAKELAGKMLYG